ncbi:unnamed protein product [Linum tenue]|uniref:Gnk2-homologous domain-containing protein n=2 Tax=Linum tenue TaxID=586396 RepID=A0AAV0LG38_9ROSI|nr:unnamed protein product [Linum tenue]
MHSAATAIVVLLFLDVILRSPVAVDGKFPDTTIMNGPDCTGKSDSKEYDDNVGYLLNTFVSGTKQSRSRNQDGDRTFLHSWPNRNPGSPTGGATCYVDLGKNDCWACLFTAKNKMYSGCHNPVSGNITLQDCSIWFNRIP